MLPRSRCVLSTHLPKLCLTRHRSAVLFRCHLHIKSSVPASDVKIVSRHTPLRSKIAPYKFKADSRINPESLQETIEGHRKAKHDPKQPHHRRRQAVRKQQQAGGRTKQKAEAEPLTRQAKYKRLKLQSIQLNDAEYGGRSIPLTWEWRFSASQPKNLRLPWVWRLEKDVSINHDVPAIQRLGDEMLAIQTYLSPTPQEDLAAQRALTIVLEMLSQVPGYETVTYSVMGSRATALHSPLSDVDLSASCGQAQPLSKEQTVQMLGKMFSFLKYSALAELKLSGIVAHKIRQSRIPVMDFGHLASGLRFQLQCSGESYDTIEITKAYLAEFQYLEQIYRVVKQMLLMRGLCLGQQGGITSYPLFHMVVASLKFQGSTGSPASQLLDFLKLYSDIDFYSTAIEYHRDDVRHTDDPGMRNRLLGHDPLSLQPKLVRRDTRGLPYLMSLQDPANLDNDLGRNGLEIKHVQALFIDALEKITNAMRLWDQMYERGVNMRAHGVSILARCLEGDYSRSEAERRQLRSFASPADDL